MSSPAWKYGVPPKSCQSSIRFETGLGSLVGAKGHGQPPGQAGLMIEMIDVAAQYAPLTSVMRDMISCEPGPSAKPTGKSNQAKSVQKCSDLVYSTPSIHSSRLEGSRLKSKRRKFTVIRSG